MKTLYKAALLSTVLLAATNTFAVVCYNNKGANVVDNVNYDLSSAFNSSNNKPGSVVELSKIFFGPALVKCIPHTTTNPQTKRSYVANLPVLEYTNFYKYLRINDYLSGAMRITDSYAGDFYPPVNYVQMGTHHNVPLGQPFVVDDRNFLFRIKVLRPFIDHVVIPKQTMFTVYVTTERTDPLVYPVYTISYSGAINVPQSCQINAGQIISIPFGKVGAHLFNQAGAKPETINPVERQIGIQCSNINAQAMLTLRLESEKSSGDSIVSSNPDVGFQVSNQTGNLLRPNDLTSKIKFVLDPTANATIPLKFWPVSLTGNKPAVGLATARGYLRVDFD